MPSDQWKFFNNIKEMATKIGDPAISEKVDPILSAAMEAIADTLPAATTKMLRAGAAAARDALEAFTQLDAVDELSPSFIAGRLASAVDVLGYASYQTVDEQIIQLARTQPYARVLAALMEGPMRNVDLAAKLDKDEPRTSKWLSTLRENGLVMSVKHGRASLSALTPAGRNLVEAGWQDERRASLQASNLIDMRASRYDLAFWPAPTDVNVREVPRISASGG